MPALFAHLFYGGLDGAAERLAVILIPVVITLSSLPPDLNSNLVSRLMLQLFTSRGMMMHEHALDVSNKNNVNLINEKPRETGISELVLVGKLANIREVQ